METSPKSNVILFNLALCLGFLGIHRFYAGRLVTGILMLLTLGGLYIWWGIDIYRIIRGRMRDNKKRVITWKHVEPEGKHIFAGFWIRVSAMCIDGIVVSFLFLPLIIIFFVSGGMELFIMASKSPLSTQALLVNLPGFLLYGLYFIYHHSSQKQATIGKKTVGVYVINSKGGRLSLLNAAGRYFSLLITTSLPSYILLYMTALSSPETMPGQPGYLGSNLFFLSITIPYIGYIMAGLTKKKRAAHDYIASTYVVHGKPGNIIKP